MANHKSALKRARQNINRRMRNRSARTRVKNIIKDVRLSVKDKSREAVMAELNKAKSIIYKTAQKGIIHKRTASRKISRLSKMVNASLQS
ncbi:MAG: 30S ribosomal protein S20 [Deltaproteobacteria bacterium]|nr:30S ribosomal protein S20 [Deltaproteobacteria bacterium]